RSRTPARPCGPPAASAALLCCRGQRNLLSSTSRSRWASSSERRSSVMIGSCGSGYRAHASNDKGRPAGTAPCHTPQEYYRVTPADSKCESARVRGFGAGAASSRRASALSHFRTFALLVSEHRLPLGQDVVQRLAEV